MDKFYTKSFIKGSEDLPTQIDAWLNSFFEAKKRPYMASIVGYVAIDHSVIITVKQYKQNA